MFRVLVPRELSHKTADFVRANGLPFEIVRDGAADLRIEIPDEPLQSTLTTLYQGGFMNCPSALALAERAGVEPHLIGMLLDFLEIKVRHCSLGLFG